MSRVYAFWVSLGSVALGSCNVAEFEARTIQKTASKACAKAGLTPDHPEYAQCASNTAQAYVGQAEAERQRTRDTVGILAGSYAAGYYGAQRAQPREIGRPSQSRATPQPPIAPALPRRLCPDGTYVTGLTCSLAPNGTYTAGQPRMAPDGSYVGFPGRIIMCPDGSYVAGSQCRLAPNGQYVGVQ